LASTGHSGFSEAPALVDEFGLLTRTLNEIVGEWCFRSRALFTGAPSRPADALANAKALGEPAPPHGAAFIAAGRRRQRNAAQSVRRCRYAGCRTARPA
jgi:hypothetical protein